MTQILDEEHTEALLNLDKKARNECLLREESQKLFLAFRSLLYVVSGKDQSDMNVVIQVWNEYLIDDPNIGQDKVDVPSLLRVIRDEAI